MTLVLVMVVVVREKMKVRWELQVREHKLYITLNPPDSPTASFRRELSASW